MADYKSDIIYGNRVTLRKTTEGDLPDLMVLWNDGRVMKWVDFPDGLGCNLEKMIDWFNKLQANLDCHHFVVHAEGIGFCGEVYFSVNRIQKRAGLDIKFRPEAQGQGLATEALKTLISFIFETEPDVEAVWTEPSEENIVAQKMYERCGLRQEPRPLDMEHGCSYWELRREDSDRAL